MRHILEINPEYWEPPEILDQIEMILNEYKIVLPTVRNDETLNDFLSESSDVLDVYALSDIDTFFFNTGK